MSTISAPNEFDVFSRVVQPERPTLSPEAARSILAMSFSPSDVERINALSEKARAGTLAPEELRGSTFSVTSAGKLGGLFVTPLVNHPEVAILGVHRIGPRAVVRDGEIVARRRGNVSVTFDHRVVDGARAAAFTLAVIDRLQGGSD